MSLAKKFITDKLEEYLEPTRLGMRRGERVGMNRQKYAAALFLAIYELGSDKIGETLEVKSSLVSKWKTEKPFKDKVFEIRNDFIDYICMDITNYVSSGQFSDAGLYNDNIKKQLLEVCNLEANKGNASFLLSIWPALRSMFVDVSNQASEVH